MGGTQHDVSIRRDGDALIVGLVGRWRIAEGIPSVRPVEEEVARARPAKVAFDSSLLGEWDTGLVAFARRVVAVADARGVDVDRAGLPPGARHLFGMAEAVPARKTGKVGGRPSLLARVGTAVAARGGRWREVLAFTGETTRALGRMMTGRARYRRRELALHMQQAGASALGIVTLVSFLVGMILAFVGAVQLQGFGAQVFVADLVAVAMVRELGALMTAIVLAGRTGAAFAAELGTMRVTQETEALTTFGISATEFVVLPRLLGLVAMIPLLCVYAILVGVLGGAVVGVGMMDIQAPVYYQHTLEAVTLGDLAGGVFKATVYGFLVAGAGCFEGMRAGRSAGAVGKAATSAVVDGIILVIAACGLFSATFYVLGI